MQNTAVAFLLDGNLYGNNSVVSLLKIHEEEDALICLTGRSECCTGRETGNWYFPSSLKVGTRSENSNIYVNKGANIVLLNRRIVAPLPNGVFHCKIPSANGTSQNIYIGIYDEEAGRGAVSAEDLTFNKKQQALSCISTGGPPTILRWLKNDRPLNPHRVDYRQTQSILNASRSMYNTTLFLHPVDQHEVIGNYTCMVNNSRVTPNSLYLFKKLEIQGKYPDTFILQVHITFTLYKV